MADQMRYEQVVPAVGDVRYERCSHCGDDNLATSVISAITSQDVRTIGGWAVCGSCGWSPYGGGDG